MSDWHEANRVGRFGVAWVLAIFGIVAVLSAAVWFFTVGTSDIKGRGDAVKVRNSAVNRIAAQQQFEQYIAEIKQTDAKLDVAAADKKAHPDDQTIATNYTGLMNHCLDTAGQYNALARSYTAEQFRAVDLPQQIDTSDPTTDCKETK